MLLSRHLLFLFFAATAFSSSLSSVRAEDDTASDAESTSKEFDLQALQSDLLNTIDRVRPAVVNIFGGGTGFSGVIVSPDGQILSAGHAVRPGTQYRITLPDGRRFRGIGKGSNQRLDCALIQITNPDDDLPHVPMGDSSSLVRNQPCFGLSYPGGQKAGREPVARFGRIVRTGRSQSSMFQSSALMEPGDSGGPLFDFNGYVIGIHSRIGRSMASNYEVPVNTFRGFWNELNRERTFVRSGPPTPRIGVRCTPAPDPENEGEFKGIKILSVVDDGLAAKTGLKADDVMLKFYDREMSTLDQLRQVLVDARDGDAETIKIELQRGEEQLNLEMAFDVEREAAPDVELPEIDHPSVPTPQSFEELSRLANQLADLESQLDDACVEITSVFGDEETRDIVGTRIVGTNWVLSKSSVIGSDPIIEADDADSEDIALSIVQRDTANDIVLLKAPDVHAVGVDLDAVASELPMGTFLLTPDANGNGLVSVVGSSAFRSRKFSSRGFLGVVPETYQDNEGAVLNEVTEDGAAKRAGLLVGDVITKMNDTAIRSQQDMRNFLMRVDANAVITATLRRDEDELTKSITLGAVPNNSRHAADQMAKSGRRDGFRQVFPHDANLEPDECGGPVFDLSGKFVGLNIARNSRVRSFALPAAALKDFIEQASSAEE
ncbi:MAG: trypsin-like peptidase domain-containing protein [Planctomycetota bacterium]